MASVLLVVSEHGYWSEECITPLERFDEAGLDVTVATPSGQPPVVDERSIDPENVGEDAAERLERVHETDDRIRDPAHLAAVTAGEFDAVVFPGGHGTEWDVNQDTHARRLLRNTVAGDHGTALVICHAVGVLAVTREKSGDFLVDGRDVTGFPNAWEEGIVDENDVLPDGRKLPYWVEDEVRAAGANWDAELDADTSVRVDGDLVTARGPDSSDRGARTLLTELDVEASA